MSRPSILMFGWEYPPHNSGGLGVACQGICEGLIELGSNVTFVLPEKTSIEEGRVPIIFANQLTHTHIEESELDFIRKIQNPYNSASDYGDLVKKYKLVYGKDIGKGFSLIEKVDLYEYQTHNLAKKYKDVDVIHAHDWLSFGAGIAAKKVTGKPLVAHIHATEFDRSGSDSINEEIYSREKRGLEEADVVVTVSDFTKNIIIKKYGIDEAKIRVVHNGVISKQTNTEIKDGLSEIKDAGFNIVLSLGRITLQKGVDYFVRMAKIVLEYKPKTFFVIAGSGDMENQIIELANDLGISKNILFTGFVRGNTIDMLYRSADVFIMPSLSEPFGIAPLEAIVQGTPVIISKQSGVSEVVSHALKVDFWDIEGMANKVIAVLEYPKLSETLVEHSTKQVKEITWTNASRKLIDIYTYIRNKK